MKFGVSSVRSAKLTTGSSIFDKLLRGGLPIGAVTDFFGAAGTGKTQLAFQAALMTSLERLAKNQSWKKKVETIFVDCSGSFRPERVVEMAEDRGYRQKSRQQILEAIYSIRVRTIEEQDRASEGVLADPRFRSCRLVIIDDITSNFASEKSLSKRDIIERQFKLSLYCRKLAFIASSRNCCVLINNTVRSRVEDNEVETARDVVSMFTLLKVRLSKQGRTRNASLVEPFFLRDGGVSFEIARNGIS